MLNATRLPLTRSTVTSARTLEPTCSVPEWKVETELAFTAGRQHWQTQRSVQPSYAHHEVAATALQCAATVLHLTACALTSAGLRNLRVWLRYRAPGKAVPMMAGNREAHRLPGMMAPPTPVYACVQSGAWSYDRTAQLS